MRLIDNKKINNGKIKSSMIARDEKGLTLAETIIAMAILSVIVTMLSNFLSVAIRARNLSREKLQLVAIATGKMDEIISIHTFWQDIEGLQSWLVNDEFIVKENDVYYKRLTDENNTNYDFEIIIDENTGIEGFFQLNLTVKSSDSNSLTLAMRLREIGEEGESE